MQQEAADPQDAQLEASEDDPVRRKVPFFSFPFSSSDTHQEALVRTTDSSASLQVEYSVLLSPTYQVPVLYFMLRCNHQGPVGIDAVYQNLVPDQYRKELKNVGVMGGISFDVCARALETKPYQNSFRSIIQGLALRHFLFILATPQML
ncbi:hypothetical protein AWENTII_008487 [Aspergillus wentii]